MISVDQLPRSTKSPLKTGKDAIRSVRGRKGGAKKEMMRCTKSVCRRGLSGEAEQVEEVVELAMSVATANDRERKEGKRR
jgi:hypothetical protein